MPKSKQDRRTPQWLFDWLNGQFGPFDLDAAATTDEGPSFNALCGFAYTEKEDALSYDSHWMAKTFCNPPFRNIDKWVGKAIHEAKERGVFTLMLCPAAGSQDWFHDLARMYTVLFPNQRINFDDEFGNPTGPGHDEPGADRDTTVLLIGSGFENPLFDDGRFCAYVLDLKSVPRA